MRLACAVKKKLPAIKLLEIQSPFHVQWP